MIRITSVPGNRKVFRQIKNIPRSFRNGIRAAHYEIGKDLKIESQRSIMEGPKTGRLYRVKGKIHQASAPGEPPANKSGKLMSSIGFLVGGRGIGQLTFGAKALYAAFLELGTAKMEPRTYLIKAIWEKRRVLENYYYQEITRRLTRND